MTTEIVDRTLTARHFFYITTDDYPSAPTAFFAYFRPLHPRTGKP